MRRMHTLVRSASVAALFLFALAGMAAAVPAPALTTLGSYVGDPAGNEPFDSKGGAEVMTACEAPDNGTGTIDLPAACPYVAPLGTMHIKDGLPPGTTIEIVPTLASFSGAVRVPGGTLGGEIITVNAEMSLLMTGTGALGGFSRSLTVPVQLEIHTAPRTPGTSPQSFDADLYRLSGQITGDPDFDLLRITGGTGNTLPSPGHTTLSKKPAGNWMVDSFFDITYRIDFQGAPGGAVAGMSGSTTDLVRLSQGGPFWQPGDDHKMHFPQLPDLAGWDVYATNPLFTADDWQCSETGAVKDIHFWGSWLNGVRGKIESFQVGIYADVPVGGGLAYSHPGTKLWERVVNNYVETPFSSQTAEGFYTPYSGFFVHPDHFQYFQYDIVVDSTAWFQQTKGTIYWLAITANVVDTLAGRRWGWKSSLDHFNDDGAWRRFPGTRCFAPDNGSGTVSLPAPCNYDSRGGLMQITDGLPPGTTIDMPPTLHTYMGQVEMPGGSLGGNVHQFQALLNLPMTGTGALAGFSKVLDVPVQVENHTAPRIPGTPVQDFDAQNFFMQGQITGDPDFDLLRVTSGTAFGMPSPGHFTLALQPAGDWVVESFFDITYQIDFSGAPGGPLAGLSGSNTATIRIYQGGGADTLWQELKEPPSFGRSLDLAFVITGGRPPCCIGIRGNANGDVLDKTNVSDVTYLLAYLFGIPSGPPPPCPEEANANGDALEKVNVADVTYLLSYLFGIPPGPAPKPCP